MSLPYLLAFKAAIFLSAILGFYLFIDWLRAKWGMEKRTTGVCEMCFMGLLVALVVGMVWLAAIRESQLAPHWVTSHIGSTIISQHLESNPEHISFEFQTVVSNNALVTVAKPVTNYYWHVWSIFK